MPGLRARRISNWFSWFFPPADNPKIQTEAYLLTLGPELSDLHRPIGCFGLNAGDKWEMADCIW